MRNRIKYSQNFLTDRKLVENLVAGAHITPNDTVLEIGAGEGIITEELIKKAGHVIAYELDNNFFGKLSKKFQGEKLIDLKHEDFLNSPLPAYPYKIFSNIPFNITSAIIKKLTLAESPPEDSYLILQKEAAAKFAGKPLDIKNSQMAVILHPRFEFGIVYEFKPNDFFPHPSVNIILLNIKKRTSPLVKDKEKYRDFVTYTFNQPKPNITEGLSKIMKVEPTNSKPSELDFADWISLFELFLKLPLQKQNLVNGVFTKQRKDQESIEKSHRTRLDPKWKKY